MHFSHSYKLKQKKPIERLKYCGIECKLKVELKVELLFTREIVLGLFANYFIDFDWIAFSKLFCEFEILFH